MHYAFAKDCLVNKSVFCASLEHNKNNVSVVFFCQLKIKAIGIEIQIFYQVLREYFSEVCKVFFLHRNTYFVSKQLFCIAFDVKFALSIGNIAFDSITCVRKKLNNTSDSRRRTFSI